MGCVYQFWVHRMPIRHLAVVVRYPGPMRAAYRLRRVTLTAYTDRRLPAVPPEYMFENEFRDWRVWCEDAGFAVEVVPDPAQV